MGLRQHRENSAKIIMIRSNSFSGQNTIPHTPNPISSAIRTTSFHNLIDRHRVNGRYAEMESLCQFTLEIQEQTLGREHFEVAITLNDLAEACHLQGKHAKAELLYKRSLAILKTTLGREHPRVATTLSNLARLHVVESNYAQAEQCYLRSLAIQKKKLGSGHPDVALNLKNMAELYNKWSLATLLRTTGQVSEETDSLVSPAPLRPQS